MPAKEDNIHSDAETKYHRSSAELHYYPATQLLSFD